MDFITEQPVRINESFKDYNETGSVIDFSVFMVKCVIVTCIYLFLCSNYPILSVVYGFTVMCYVTPCCFIDDEKIEIK